MSDDDRNSKVRKSYQVATNRLREKYSEEFRQLQTEAAAELGIDYKPRATKVEKAREQLAELLRENPALEDEVIDKVKGILEKEKSEGKPAVAEVPQG